MMRISGPSRFYRSIFILVVAVFFYGTLYPFEFSFSVGRMTDSLAKMEWIPFWDSGRGRLHGIPDMVSNVLFAMPLGFFGLLAQRRGKGRKLLSNWWLIGLACGVTAEFLQLFSDERMASLTDAINAGVGAGAGAFLAGRWEKRVTLLFGETTADEERIRLLLLFTLLVVGTLGPLDMTMDVSDLRADFASFLADPWGLHAPLQEEWILMAEYLVFGALAGRRIRSPLIVALPIALESGQLFIASRVPSIGDALLGVVALSAGRMAGRIPALFKARNALVVVVAAIAAAGLSPYRVASWEARVPFQWIPLVEYYRRTTLSSLFDAAMGVLSFGLLAALIRASLRVGRLAPVALCVALAASIEIAQMWIPGRYPGITDVMTAALGGWLGASLRNSVITAAAENPIGAIPSTKRSCARSPEDLLQ